MMTTKLKSVALATLTTMGLVLSAQAEEKCTDCITFSADKAFGIKMRKTGTPPESTLEYSTDQLNWKSADKEMGNDAKQDGGTYKIHFRGKGNGGVSASPLSYFAFTNTATSAATAIACSGNIMTLLDYEKVAKKEDVTMKGNAFCRLFMGFERLTAAPTLPATELSYRCYYGMFQGCTSLTAAPTLPAKTLTGGCYIEMFKGCTTLTDIPALDVAVVTNGCFQYMFQGCSSLMVNTMGLGKEWKIPSDVKIADTATFSGNAYWASNMFAQTSGTVKDGAQIMPGTVYYVKSAITPVTVIVPEVMGASAELFAFSSGGGWTAVAANEVPSNAMVRVVWTADAGKSLTADKVVSVYKWQETFGPVVGGETAPAPTVGEVGASSVTFRVDTSDEKKYFDVKDIPPVWYAAGAEVNAKAEGESEWTMLVKAATTTNTLAWAPTKQGTYTFSHVGFGNEQIIFTIPVEVDTNGLAIAGTTFEVKVDGGKLPDDGIVASNSEITVVWTANKGVYFVDGTSTYEQKCKADKSVNVIATAVEKPEEPKVPSMNLGVVAQRYPWNGLLDVQYRALNTPKDRYQIKVTVTLPDERTASEKHKALSGINTATFDIKEHFGEVFFLDQGAKVTAELVEEKE